MASRNYIGNKPLGHRTPDATKGTNNALAKLTQDIAMRTPVSSGSSQQVPSGVLLSPRRWLQREPKKLPWAITSRGEDTVYVSKGEVLSLREDETTDALYTVPFSYDGNEVSITDDKGWVYAIVTTSDTTGDILTLEVEFSTDSPATIGEGLDDQFYIPIGEVKIENGMASVDKQILNYNPILFSTPPASTHPWKVVIEADEETSTAKITPGRIMTGMLSVDGQLLKSETGVVVAVDKTVCIETTHSALASADTYAIISVTTSTYTPYDAAGDPAEVSKSRYPLANIVADGTDLVVNQIARANLAVAYICSDGQPVRSFTTV